MKWCARIIHPKTRESIAMIPLAMLPNDATRKVAERHIELMNGMSGSSTYIYELTDNDERYQTTFDLNI